MNEASHNKGYGRWLFLSLVLLAYGLLWLIEPQAATDSFTFFTHILAQVLPALGLVFLLLFITNLLLEPKWVKRYLGKESGIKGWVAAVAGGILSMGPVYAWYTMLSELRKHEIRSALIAAFLYSRSIKIPFIPLMIHYFGLSYTLTLYFYLILFSVISGKLVEKLSPQSNP
jgi:uncharacterized membrane protein YraQ (UPF0718 family)